MQTLTRSALLVLPLLASCAAGTRWHADDALAAEAVELEMLADGTLAEIEYHVKPEGLPAAALAAMERLYPGGRVVGGEKEYVGGELYWEVVKEIDGLDHEVMFAPDGSLHSEEVEVRASAVPVALREAARAWLGADASQWEEIRDGSRALVEYHAKGAQRGRDYKLMLTLDGRVRRVVREIRAEIEVAVE